MKKIIILVTTVFFIFIMSTAVYGFFNENEKILPLDSNGNPTYDEFTAEYTNHSEDIVLDDGVTVYFDVTSLLPGFNAPTFYYFVNDKVTSVVIRNNGWTETDSKRMKFDSVKTVNPTDLTKVNTQINVSGTKTTYPNSLGGVTWSGTWVKIKVNDAKFDISSSERRSVIIHVGNAQTGNTISISKGVKEVYIKGAAVDNVGGSSLNWKSEAKRS